MRRPYNPQLGYSPQRDVRTYDDLVELLRDSQPTGFLWPLIGTRRSGKTWALRAVEHTLGEQAARLDFTGHEQLPEPPEAPILLIDEPGRWLLVQGNGPTPRPDPVRVTTFIAWCRRLKTAGRRLLVAMTPAEWSALAEHSDRTGCVSPTDLQPHLRPLTPAQATRIARDAAAAALLGAVAAAAPDWLRNPFLATHLLDFADRHGRLVPDTDVHRLVAEARAELHGAQYDYISRVLYDGLDDKQQQALRALVRRERAEPRALELLRMVGLVDRDPGGRFDGLRDPVLADHLPPPLRIHHVSDIHAGPKSAQRVHAGPGGPAAARLAHAVGDGPVRDSYLEHLTQRAGEGTGPHLAIVSGDLTETGQPQEYADARDFLVALGRRLGSHPDLDADDARVLLVGGNHDVDWTRTRGANGARARHLAFARTFADYPRPRLEHPPDTREIAVVRYRGAGLEVVLLGSAEHGGEVDEATDTLLRRAREAAERDGSIADAEQADKLRGLAKSDPGLVHKEDLRRLRSYGWSEPVRLAVLHHPVSPLPTTTDIAPYAGLLNAAAVKDACIAVEIHLILHGHAHSQWFIEERWPSHSQADHTLRIAAAPSLGSREVYEQHGYNEILVVREGDRYEVTVRGYVREGDTWRPNGSLPPFVARPRGPGR